MVGSTVAGTMAVDGDGDGVELPQADAMTETAARAASQRREDIACSIASRP
jgi:hypothetical protein